MTLTTHAVASVIIADYIPWPFLAFLVSLFFHYVLDIIPHGDEFLYWRYVKNKRDKLPLIVATVDILLMLFLVWIFWLADQTLPWYLVIAAAFGGILPDLLINLHTQARSRFGKEKTTRLGELEKIYHQFLQVHYKWHMWWHFLTKKTTRFRYGIAMQVVFLILLYWFQTTR